MSAFSKEPHRGYPSTSADVRTKLERLSALPDRAPEWTEFLRTEIRLLPWMMAALQAGVRAGGWRDARDPVAQLRGTVHRLAIEMRLSNPFSVSVPLTEEAEDD